MDILSEYELRAMRLPQGTETFAVDADVFVLPGAKEYLKERGIALVIKEKSAQKEHTAMPMGQRPADGKYPYVDYETGEGYTYKPEHMTHIRDNLLVPKTHPRIAFRGKLDSLQALVLQTQIVAMDENKSSVCDDLESVNHFIRLLLSAEVNDQPLAEIDLLGMNSQRLRYVSHHVSEELGVSHLLPDCRMGKLCVQLNFLRTQVREVELSAANAFAAEEGKGLDIIEGLNRLSSCVYIIYCRVLAGYYDKQ